MCDMYYQLSVTAECIVFILYCYQQSTIYQSSYYIYYARWPFCLMINVKQLDKRVPANIKIVFICARKSVVV